CYLHNEWCEPSDKATILPGVHIGDGAIIGLGVSFDTCNISLQKLTFMPIFGNTSYCIEAIHSLNPDRFDRSVKCDYTLVRGINKLYSALDTVLYEAVCFIPRIG
ncbi:MAG: hypothetical protein K2L34_08825, partial [Muribaculaceae bacterium]|nr:hypothetical protein [Muribaculaceae bacterium]